MSWLPALRTWYHFRLCFSFTCFVFDLTLIKRNHTLNCYSFLNKFLLKTNITLLVTVIAQFSGRKTNLEKAIYFFSIMSFSINKLKSHLFFTCKNLCFVVLCRKNFLLKVMVVVVVVLCVCVLGGLWFLFGQPRSSLYNSASYSKTTLTIWPNRKTRGQNSQFSNYFVK